MSTSKLTLPRLQAILQAVVAHYMLSEADTKQIVGSAKVGQEASNHVGYKSQGYFCSEGTSVTSWYYDAIQTFDDFKTRINEGLKPFGLYLELKNCCEFTIHAI